MKKIVIAGAGAYFFAPAIFEDLFVRFRMEAEYWMVDADLDMAELSARGIGQLDFVYIIGDAYVDHPSFGPAIEGALKMEETIGIPSNVYETEEFLHGPVYEIKKERGKTEA